MLFAIDFDGSLVHAGLPMRIRPEAEQTVRALHKAGHTLILHSVRCFAPVQHGDVYCSAQERICHFEEMKAFLLERGLWTVDHGGVFDLVWRAPGKPYADLYLDDKAHNVRDADGWASVLAQYG